MEEEILTIDTETGKVKVLGIEVNAKPKQIKILINGVDIIKNINIRNIKIIKEVE